MNLENLEVINDAFTQVQDGLNLEIDNLEVGCITSKNDTFSLDSEGNLTVNSLTTNEGSNQGTIDNQSICNLIYPVGSIYLSVNATNPAALFGGTWVSWGAGRVPVGVDTSQVEFNTVEKVNGSETKTHTLDTNQIPWHTHQEALPNTYRIGVSGGTGAYISDGTNPSYPYPGGCYWSSQHTNGVGGTGAHNNLQPYITTYMWKRTS